MAELALQIKHPGPCQGQKKGQGQGQSQEQGQGLGQPKKSKLLTILSKSH